MMGGMGNEKRGIRQQESGTGLDMKNARWERMEADVGEREGLHQTQRKARACRRNDRRHGTRLSGALES